jgi:hypothetical protein
VNVRLPGAKLMLDSRDFAAAPGDSCNHLSAFLGEFIERVPVAVEDSLLSGVLLPAENDYVHILRIELRTVTDAPGLLRRNQSSSTAEKRILATLAG